MGGGKRVRGRERERDEQREGECDWLCLALLTNIRGGT